MFASLLVAVMSLAVSACRSDEASGRIVRPRTLRDVPAERLAFRFDADTGDLPPSIADDGASENLASVAADFETRRTEEALLRTVVSPDGQRALALYATAATEGNRFRMDLYASDGRFLRNMFPAELNGVIPDVVAWSPDGNQIAFIGLQDATLARATPTPPPAEDTPADITTLPQTSATPAATVMPLIPSVPTFSTGQIYTCDRDGFNIRPLTTREGLIYFHLTWSPDGMSLAALACRDTEWDARLAEALPPGGRPRLIGLDGRERLLDDRLTDVLPVWSPDGSKIATAFGTDVAIYDVAGETPTGARLPLEEQLLAASVRYDANASSSAAGATNANANSANNTNAASSNTTPSGEATAPPTDATPLSFNPVVRLEWARSEILFVQTGFVRIYGREAITRFMRWHTLHLSPQAALLGDHRALDRLHSPQRNALACGLLCASL